jgi:hypothetical protein
VPLDVVQLLLGHSDPKTTQLYARLSLAPARREYDRAMAGLAAGTPASAYPGTTVVTGETPQPSPDGVSGHPRLADPASVDGPMPSSPSSGRPAMNAAAYVYVSPDRRDLESQLAQIGRYAAAHA